MSFCWEIVKNCNYAKFPFKNCFNLVIFVYLFPSSTRVADWKTVAMENWFLIETVRKQRDMKFNWKTNKQGNWFVRRWSIVWFLRFAGLKIEFNWKKISVRVLAIFFCKCYCSNWIFIEFNSYKITLVRLFFKQSKDDDVNF